MVLAPHPSMLADESPLALLRLRRAEADAALRRSLATASMLALTAAVALLLARALLFAPPELRVIELPPIINIGPSPGPPPIPTGDPPRQAARTDEPGPIQEIDHEAPVDKPVVDPAPPIASGGQGNGPATGDARPGNGEGIPGPPPEPLPGDFTYTEVLPNPVFQPRPEYPEIARTAGMEGRVVVRMLIGLDGRVRRAEMEKSNPMFDAEALEAARRWTFTPALTDGKPVMVWVRVPFEFRLH